MLIALIVIALLVLASIAATVVALRTDGYGPRPHRADRFADSRRLI